MIALAIILFIVLVIYILLHISLHAYVDLTKGKAQIRLTYLGIKLWSNDDADNDSDSHKPDDNAYDKKHSDQTPNVPQFELTEIKEVDSSLDDETTDLPVKDTADDKPESYSPQPDDSKSDDKLSSIKDTINEYKPYFPIAKKALRKLIKLIRITDLEVDITVGDSDAYKAGKLFGNVNALFYSVLGLICCLFTVKIKHTEIKCDFNSKNVDARLSTCIKARPSAILCLLIYLAVNYLKIKKHKDNIKENENHE